jgi:hypothetical protein
MLALSAWSATFGIIVVFGVAFPVLVQGLLGFIAAAIAGERRQNQEYRSRGRSTSAR